MIDISTHNQHNKKYKNTDTMLPPMRQLPAASILKVSMIAVSRAIDLNLHNTAMQYFLCETKCSFNLLTIILQEANQCALRLQMSF
jgi:hypothetical protein